MQVGLRVFKKEMEERGLLLPYASREEFESWLETADAFLITQRFEREAQPSDADEFPIKAFGVCAVWEAVDSLGAS